MTTLVLLAAALVGCSGEAPPPSAATTAAGVTTAAQVSGWVTERPTLAPVPRTQVVAATLRAESLDTDGDGVPDRERSFEGLQPLSDVKLPSSLR